MCKYRGRGSEITKFERTYFMDDPLSKLFFSRIDLQKIKLCNILGVLIFVKICQTNE